MLDNLYELEPETTEDGDQRPVNIGLTREGKRKWIDFYNQHAQEHLDLEGDMSAASSKLEGYAARLALVIHCIRWAADDPTLEHPDAVDAESITAGVELAQWFGHEAQCVYRMANESDDDQDCKRVLQIVQRHGGRITARQLQQADRQCPSSVGADAVLQLLVKRELGHWERVEHDGAGRPTREFVLAEASTVYEIAQNAEGNSKYVDRPKEYEANGLLTEAAEERAAIMEFEGGLSRELAERFAGLCE